MKYLWTIVTSMAILWSVVCPAAVEKINTIAILPDSSEPSIIHLEGTVHGENSGGGRPLGSGVVRYEVNDTDDSRTFLYELEDGQFRQEEIRILNRGTDDEEISVIGRFKFIGVDGKLYDFDYTSSRNGYIVMKHKAPSRNRISPIALKSLIG